MRACPAGAVVSLLQTGAHPQYFPERIDAASGGVDSLGETGDIRTAYSQQTTAPAGQARTVAFETCVEKRGQEVEISPLAQPFRRASVPNDA